MPLYEYQCTKCKRRTEKIERVAGPHLRKCPHCGGKVERLQSAPSIQFKGSGWYVTDYAGKSGGKESPAEKADKAEKTESKEAAKESAAKGKRGERKQRQQGKEDGEEEELKDGERSGSASVQLESETPRPRHTLRA